MRCICREYPNKLDQVLNGPGDLKSPRDLHPSFYGCFDWHSSVHGHWMLVKLLKLFDLPEANQIRAMLDENLSKENLFAECEFFKLPNTQSFERPYGWGWLLKLAQELQSWDDPEGRRWALALQPLETAIVDRYARFFPAQTYPVRVGTHANTAFGLSFGWDYALATGKPELAGLIAERAKTYYVSDRNHSAQMEPGGADFLSPSLVEADLLRRILTSEDFARWLHDFLPNLALESSLLVPASVSDRSDPQTGHLDGLNLSRAWCMRGIASALPHEDPYRGILKDASARHAEEGLKHIATGDYLGEHWLASFAVYLLTN